MSASPDRTAVVTFTRAWDLPAEWDALCESTLQRRDLLAHYERTQPCEQRYLGLVEDDRLVAGAVTYTIAQSLLTFLADLPGRVRLRVLGLPASVSPRGLVGEPLAARRLLRHFLDHERGLRVALNLEPAHVDGGMRPLRMLPDLVLRNRFPDFEAYVTSLRSPWRRRLRRSRARFAGIRTERTGCDAFTARHYHLYRDVLARAEARLETLTPAFFAGLPRPLELVSCYRGDALVCWRIVLVENRRLAFVLGGHDYALNASHDAYFNNLLGLVEEGIALGVDEIELGQTAEDPKARLGAEYVELSMVLRHDRRIVDGLLGLASPVLAYRREPVHYHVFRQKEARA